MKLEKRDLAETEMIELIKRRNDAAMERKYHEDKMHNIQVNAERIVIASRDCPLTVVDDKKSKRTPISKKLLEKIRAEGERDKRSTSTYSFPSQVDLEEYSDRLGKISDNQLLILHSKLGAKARTTKKPYIDIRNRFCAVSIEMNIRNLISPAFRKFRRLHKYKGLDDNDKLLSNDWRVIDIHYLHLNHASRINPTEVQYRKLFDGSDFDFGLASIYASEKWLSATKTNKSFKIPDSIQKELSVLCNRSIKAQYARIKQNSKGIEQKLMQKTLKANSRLNEESVPEYVDCYKCLKFTNGSPLEAVNLLEKMTGYKSRYKTLHTARETMRKRKKWFEVNMGISKW